jgi:hypothetical protein
MIKKSCWAGFQGWNGNSPFGCGLINPLRALTLRLSRTRKRERSGRFWASAAAAYSVQHLGQDCEDLSPPTPERCPSTP